MNTGKTHGQILEPRMRQLNEKVQAISFDEELFKIIHFPGFTTPAEFYLIKENLEMMHQLADMLHAQMKIVLTGARNVVAGSEQFV